MNMIALILLDDFAGLDGLVQSQAYENSE